MANLLRNGSFKANWSEERSHQCIRITGDGVVEFVERSNIFTPPGWLVWYREEEGLWGQPEGREATGTNPDRMRSGDRGYLLFTFSQRQDAGLLQQVEVVPETRVRLEVWAHAWSNHEDQDQPGRHPHPDDPMWSEGAGIEAFFSLEGGLDDKPGESEISNFTFWVGIDPKGGRDPFAKEVAWGQGAHIYNKYAQVPAVEVTAQRDTITIFTRAKTRFPIKHNDAYWDDASLKIVEEEGMPESLRGRGEPRIQYERFYVLLPPGADSEWAQAIIEATWNEHRYTVGGSADDAGTGDLDSRIVLAVNPDQWGGPKVLREFFKEHYPGVRYRSVSASSPSELVKKIQEK